MKPTCQKLIQNKIKSVQRSIRAQLRQDLIQIDMFLNIFADPSLQFSYKDHHSQMNANKKLDYVFKIMQTSQYYESQLKKLPHQFLEPLVLHIRDVILKNISSLISLKCMEESFKTIKIGMQVLNHVNLFSKDIFHQFFQNQNLIQGILFYLNKNNFHGATILNIWYIVNTLISLIDPVSKGPEDGSFFSKLCAVLIIFLKSKQISPICKMYALSLILRICTISGKQLLQEIMNLQNCQIITQIILHYCFPDISLDLNSFISCNNKYLPQNFIKSFIRAIFTSELYYERFSGICNRNKQNQLEQIFMQNIQIICLNNKITIGQQIYSKYDHLVTPAIRQYLNQILEEYPPKKIHDHYLQNQVAGQKEEIYKESNIFQNYMMQEDSEGSSGLGYLRDNDSSDSYPYEQIKLKPINKYKQSKNQHALQIPSMNINNKQTVKVKNIEVQLTQQIFTQENHKDFNQFKLPYFQNLIQQNQSEQMKQIERNTAIQNLQYRMIRVINKKKGLIVKKNRQMLYQGLQIIEQKKNADQYN